MARVSYRSQFKMTINLQAHNHSPPMHKQTQAQTLRQRVEGRRGLDKCVHVHPGFQHGCRSRGVEIRILRVRDSASRGFEKAGVCEEIWMEMGSRPLLRFECCFHILLTAIIYACSSLLWHITNILSMLWIRSLYGVSCPVHPKLQTFLAPEVHAINPSVPHVIYV